MSSGTVVRRAALRRCSGSCRNPRLHCQHVEGVELHLVIVLSAVKAIAEQHGLTVDDKGANPVPQSRLGDQREAVCPIVLLRVNSRTSLPSSWMITR